MNTEEFEKKLQRQELRPVPGHWRQQILSEARKVESRESRIESQTNKSWIYQLLWPCPQAWGALAAIWVFIFFLNITGTEPEPAIVKTDTKPREVLVALKLQLQVCAEMMSASDVPVAEPPKLTAPQSRIDASVQLLTA